MLYHNHKHNFWNRVCLWCLTCCLCAVQWFGTQPLSSLPKVQYLSIFSTPVLYNMLRLYCKSLQWCQQSFVDLEGKRERNALWWLCYVVSGLCVSLGSRAHYLCGCIDLSPLAGLTAAPSRPMAKPISTNIKPTATHSPIQSHWRTHKPL